MANVEQFFQDLNKNLEVIKSRFEYTATDLVLHYYLRKSLQVIENESFVIDINVFDSIIETISNHFSLRDYKNKEINYNIRNIFFAKVSKNVFLDNKFLLRYFCHIHHYYHFFIDVNNKIDFNYEVLKELLSYSNDFFNSTLVYLFNGNFLNYYGKLKASQIIDNFTVDFLVKITTDHISPLTVSEIIHAKQFSYEDLCKFIINSELHFDWIYYDVIINNEKLTKQQQNSLIAITKLNDSFCN